MSYRHNFLVTCEFNPIALRKAKIVYNFGFSECNRVKVHWYTLKRNNSSIVFSPPLFNGDQLLQE